MHPHTIFVTSLADMPHYVDELSPARVVSIIQPELQPARPRSLEPQAHLRIGVHDISSHTPDGILPGIRDVEALVEFLDGWDPERGALLSHCYAGVSRSTAAGLIAAVMKTGDPTWSALRLRSAAPHAIPNPRIIELADQILGLAGTLVEARAMMGAPSVSPEEARIAVLRIRPGPPG